MVRTVKIPVRIHDMLKEEAKAKGITVHRLINYILLEHYGYRDESSEFALYKVVSSDELFFKAVRTKLYSKPELCDKVIRIARWIKRITSKRRGRRA